MTPFSPHLIRFLTWSYFLTHTLAWAPETLLGFLLFHWQLLLRLLCCLFFFRAALKCCDLQKYVLGPLFFLLTPSREAHLCTFAPKASIIIHAFMTSKVIQSIFLSLLNISIWMIGMYWEHVIFLESLPSPQTFSCSYVLYHSESHLPTTQLPKPAT